MSGKIFCSQHGNEHCERRPNFQMQLLNFELTKLTRRNVVNGEAAFAQPKHNLRGTFVGAKFSNLELPA